MAESVSIPTTLPIKVAVGHTEYVVDVIDGKPTVRLPIEHVAYLLQQATTPGTGLTVGTSGYAGSWTASSGGVDLNAPATEPEPTPEAGS